MLKVYDFQILVKYFLQDLKLIFGITYLPLNLFCALIGGFELVYGSWCQPHMVETTV